MKTYPFTLLLRACVIGLLLVIPIACTQAPAPSPALQNPTIDLDHVEVASYFPWPAPPPTVGPETPTPAPPPPTRVPLVLAFVFNIANPNPYPVIMKDLQFTVEFEAAPNEFFQVGNPFAHEDMSIPANTTNQLRVTMVLDSLVAPGNLAVTSGFHLQELGLSAGAVVQKWWETVGDFDYKIKVSGGSAVFESAEGDTVVGFEGLYPE